MLLRTLVGVHPVSHGYIDEKILPCVPCMVRTPCTQPLNISTCDAEEIC